MVNLGTKTDNFGTKMVNFGVMEGPNTSFFGLKIAKMKTEIFSPLIQLNHMTLK